MEGLSLVNPLHIVIFRRFVYFLRCGFERKIYVTSETRGTQFSLGRHVRGVGLYNACCIWNNIRELLSINEFGVNTSKIKNYLRKLLYTRQNLGDQQEWSAEIFLLR